MAQAPRSPDGNDNFIRHIVTDPKNVPDVMLLTGYLGASSEEAHERLYLSADLTNYVEIPNTAILHQAPLPKEQDAHGGVTLWVKKDAALQYKMAPAAQALANYFAGAISSRGAGRARRRRGRSRTTRHHRGALRNLQLFASLPDRNHALHQHPREYLLLPRHACLSVAEPALPVAGRLHLRGVWSFACVHPRVALRRSCRRRPSRTRWHHRAHALSQHACGSVQPPPHRCLPIERLPVSQCVYTW